MPVKVKVRGKAKHELVEALNTWASNAAGQSGTLTVSGTKVIWRPLSKAATIEEPQSLEGEGGRA